MSVLKDLEPKRVFKHFEDLSGIPRGSGNEKAAGEYILGFAEALGLKAVKDGTGNLVVYMPASKGYENAPTVILQGHIDMVCEKNNDTEFDFEKDPLRLYIDGDYIKARGTTLGADNGIAVAYSMALMEKSDFDHPAIEFVITTEEEVGMKGAAALSPDLLSGRILVNMDSGMEGIFLSACAGGISAAVTINGERTAAPKGFSPVSLRISGLNGGHSGSDIHLERANANQLMGRALDALSRGFDIYLDRINGGLKDNAITREAEAVIFVKEAEKQAVLDFAADFGQVLMKEYDAADPGLRLNAEAVDSKPEPADVFTKDSLKKVVGALLLIPYGVLAMSADIEGLVETSNNIGVVRTNGSAVSVSCLIRSSVSSRKHAAAARMRLAAEAIGAEISLSADYPSWEYDKNSKIRQVFLDSYEEMYGKPARVSALHAGLECGLFAGKLPGLDMIAIGPDMFDVHTPDESLSISSSARVWDFLLNVLGKIK